MLKNLEKLIADAARKPLEPLPPTGGKGDKSKAGELKPWEKLANAAPELQAAATADMDAATELGIFFPAVIRRLTAHYIRAKGFGFFSARQMPIFRHLEANYEAVVPVELRGHFVAWLSKPDNWLPVITAMVAPFGFVAGGNERGVWWSCRKRDKAVAKTEIPL